MNKMSSKEESITPIINNNNYGMPKPSDENQQERLALIDDLKLFLATAASNWDTTSTPLKRFHLPNGESVSCVLWNGLYFVTGTDIVRSLTFRFHAFGRPITNTKKFEEGIFSDLRNLKPGIDAQLEDPKSDLLDMLYKNNCIRTQKKQKVFFWYSVPHDRLFLDALERELKREKMGLQPTTTAIAEPATSTSLDTTQELFDQLRKSMSISAAATAHALEEEISSPCMAWDSNMSPKSATSSGFSPIDNQRSQRSNTTPTSTKVSATIDRAPVLSERAQVRRSRVNSVPTDFGQDQDLTQQHLIQQQKQQRQHYRMSHGSYFSPTSAKASTSQPRQRTYSVSTSSDSYASPSLLTGSPLNNALVNGKHQKVIGTSQQQQKQRKTSHSYHHASHENQVRRHQQQRSTKNGVLPSKSLDSNSITKTKTIFGALSLFDGSPTYKQRRRRATSTSSSVNQQQQQQQKQKASVGGGGGPNRIRRHTNSHLRTSSTSSMHGTNSISSSNVHQPPSRLAIAAKTAGFDSSPQFNQPQPPHHHHHRPPYYQSHQQQQPLKQGNQQHYQGSSGDMQQQQQQQQKYSITGSSDPVVTPHWSAMMDTSLNGLEHDEEFLGGRQLGTYDIGLHQHAESLMKNGVHCSIDGHHNGYYPSSPLHRHQEVHQFTTHALETIATATADPTTFESNAATTSNQDSSMCQQHFDQTNVLEASPDSSYSSLSSSSSSLQPSHLTTTVATVSCTSGGMVSPMEDMDFEMKDVMSFDTTGQQNYSTDYSPGRLNHHHLTPIVTDMNPVFPADFMAPPYSEGSCTMLSPDDEFSSTSSSSPSSILHYQNYYDIMASPATTNGSHGPVLLSPFKPDMHSFTPPNHHHHQSYPSLSYHDNPHHHHHNQHLQGVFHPIPYSSTHHADFNSNKHQPSYTPLTIQDVDPVYQ
ncbi:unnamed protein product [Absidia cylindrospora]